MNREWIRTSALVLVAGALGTTVRLGLHARLGDEEVALAAVNVVGWFALGLVQGRWGPRIRGLWVFLTVLGVTAFSACMTLVLHGFAGAGSIVVAGIEVLFGLVFAGIGYLITMPRGPDLTT